jgi:hypothetical protein
VVAMLSARRRCWSAAARVTAPARRRGPRPDAKVDSVADLPGLLQG